VVVDLPNELLSSESEATEVAFAMRIVVSIEIHESLYFKQHTLRYVQRKNGDARGRNDLPTNAGRAEIVVERTETLR
jgi:hypothetical protein